MKLLLLLLMASTAAYAELRTIPMAGTLYCEIEDTESPPVARNCYGEFTATVAVVTEYPVEFEVTVTPNGDGTVVVSWTAPTTREDGGALRLEELFTYTVRVDQIETLVIVADIDASFTSWVSPVLEVGTYRFKVLATDTWGLPSVYTPTVEYEVR